MASAQPARPSAHSPLPPATPAPTTPSGTPAPATPSPAPGGAPRAARPTPAGPPAAPDTALDRLAKRVKIVDVLRFVCSLSRDLVGGRERLARDRKDSFRRTLSLVWPTAQNPAGRNELLAVLVLSVLRTLLLDFSTSVVRALTRAAYRGDRSALWRIGLRAVAIAAVGAAMGSALQLCRDRLGILWRDRLTAALHERYFAFMNYYYIGTTKKPKAILDVDQRIAREAGSVSARMVSVVVLLFRALPPVIWFTAKLMRRRGLLHAMLPHLYLLVSYEWVQRVFPKNIGEMYRKQAAAQGGYFKAASKIQTHCEAIAALDGTDLEGQLLGEAFGSVASAQMDVHRTVHKRELIFKVAYSYGCRSWIQAFILLPVLRRGPGATQTVPQIMAEMREGVELMIEMLIGNGNILNAHANAVYLQPQCRRLIGLIDTLDELSAQQRAAGGTTMQQGGHIGFDGVDVHTPAGKMLVRGLSFRLDPGGALLLTGHNGAGKSSIFRCLGGLWPIQKGVITKPAVDQVFYLPQRPYNVLGSLRDQLTYPAGAEAAAKLSDNEVAALLGRVGLEHLLDDPSCQTTTNWEDRLSLGEQQRLAIARLLYHTPQFAILDECTSAVPTSVELLLYEECRRRGITYITICHRPALEAFHSSNVHLCGDGTDGAWQLRDLGAVEVPEQAPSSPKPPASEHTKISEPKPLPRRGALSKMRLLLSIMMPGSTATFATLLGAIFLRTALLQGNHAISGILQRTAVAQNHSLFAAAAALNVVSDLCAAVTDEAVTFLQDAVSVRWHQALARHGQRLFLRNKAFYRLKNIDRRIADPDSRLTQEITGMADHAAEILSRSVQPAINLAWFSYKTSRLLSGGDLAPLYGYVSVVWGLLKTVMPDHESLQREEQELEARFQFIHTRLRNHSESVAFFGGGPREREIADRALADLVKQSRSRMSREALYKASTSWLVREDGDISSLVNGSDLLALRMQCAYTASAAATASGAEVARDAGLLRSAVDETVRNFGKLAGLYEHLAKLMGSSARVCELFDALEAQGPEGPEASAAGDALGMTDCDLRTPAGDVLAHRLTCRVPRASPALSQGRTGSGRPPFSASWPGSGPRGAGRWSAPRGRCPCSWSRSGSTASPEPWPTRSPTPSGCGPARPRRTRGWSSACGRWASSGCTPASAAGCCSALRRTRSAPARWRTRSRPSAGSPSRSG
eukprot:TRINITY_DN68_c0_g3_i2.p1 TRINITY_DN68_c0_g3~~TRINITY_DN68_c0_g3_i2.p1  ORF type:complete len:1220 (+),score=308.01 TRINITY_DN68_c0_g3_i2:62-3661(+)